MTVFFVKMSINGMKVGSYGVSKKHGVENCLRMYQRHFGRPVIFSVRGVEMLEGVCSGNC